MLIIYILLPESPAWCASRNKEEKAKKNMRFIYRGVAEYDVDAQYEILAQTIAHEKQVAEDSHQVKWHSIFRGVNGVSSPQPLRYHVDHLAANNRQYLGLDQSTSPGSHSGMSLDSQSPSELMTSSIHMPPTSSKLLVLPILSLSLVSPMGYSWSSSSSSRHQSIDLAEGISPVVVSLRCW